MVTMSDTDKPTTYQAENVQSAPRKRGCVGHCLRFWWAYLLVLIAIIVLVVCLVIFVGIPNIAQSKINSATLTIEGIVVTHTETQNYTMSINSTIHSDSPVKATIDGFVGQMYLEDLEAHTPFATVTFPQTTSDSVQVVNVTNQFTNVTDLDAFTTFNTWLLLNETLRVTVTGDTYVHVSGIGKAFPITFTKTVTMPGLNNFNGTNVTSANISLQPDAQGDDFTGFVTIPNHSLVTFEIGNASFHNYLGDQDIGTVFIDNMILYPGDNNFSMRANISQPPVLAAMGLQPYCTNGGEIPFKMLGKNVTNNGQYLPYYANALAVANQTVVIDIGGALKRDLNITLPCNKDQ